VAKEREAEVGVGADAVQAVFCNIGDVIDRIGAQVGQFPRLQVAPRLLEWIKVRCVDRELLDRQPVTLGGDPVAHVPTAMRWQSVPDEQHSTLLTSFKSHRQADICYGSQHEQ
jgi:hypothetical protein